ncbi:MAG TPA: carbohydrate kinase [Ktedonobacteraceae bacterium]|jgi:fructokinase|nr:carbohydrate kinase [Ktedonobacteraceae bacterium]
MSTLVTCMGESLIDFVPLIATNSGDGQSGVAGTDFRMHSGGSILNVAVGLARLGHHVAFAGKIAEDFFGHHLLLTLKTEGVDTRFVSTAKAQTALAFVAMEEGEPVYSFYGDGTADTLLTVDDIPESLYQESSILHVGSISLLRGTTPTTVLETFKRLKGNTLLSLDPNIRAGMIHDEPAYRALLQRLIALTDILKLSNVDLAWLLPGVSMEESLLHLCGLGPALVIITQGEKGVLARSGSSETIQSAAFPITVIDTVGAGDTFCAGIIARLADDAILSRERVLALTAQELRAVINFASAAAALNCTREGANPPRRSEVEHYLQRSS